MAIDSIREGWRELRAGGETNNPTAVRVFSVVTDAASRGVFDWPQTDPTDGTTTVPAAGTQDHPDDADLYSRVPQVTLVSPTYFLVTVAYAAEPYYASPLEEDPEWGWDEVSTVEPVDYDADGEAVVNSRGDPFEPPLTKEYRDTLLWIERNVATFDLDTKLAYQDTVANHRFWGQPAGLCRMHKIKPRRIRGEMDYWRVRYEILIRNDWIEGQTAYLHGTAVTQTAEHAWYRRVPDKGRMLNDSTGNQRHPSAVGAPVLLDGTGQQLADGADTVWLIWPWYPAIDWGALGIDEEGITNPS